MAFTLVRVELHENGPHDKPTGEVYAKLHAQMQAAGFDRTVYNPAKTGALDVGAYWLPTGTYAAIKFSTANEAVAGAWNAAKGLGYTYEVAAAGSSFDGFGLKPAK